MAALPSPVFWDSPSSGSGSHERKASLAFHAAAAERVLAAMRDEEVLAQVLMFGYVGEEPPPLLLEWIQERGLGGVKIFGWNADDTARVAASVGAMQARARSSRSAVPLFVATDQEGGWIRHIKGRTSETPGNMAIGASGLPFDAYRTGAIIGRELAALGVNFNFAPTVDLATEPSSSIVGTRAFSADPSAATAFATAFYLGLDSAGVIATAKHFPGHGATSLDSHGTLPVIRIAPELFWERELVPYRVLAAEGLPAVMSGHLAYPTITGDLKPASLSSALLQGYLRERIGFEGLIVTDDLYMTGATASAGGVGAACLEAFEAGNDIVMVSKTWALDDPSWRRLIAAYREDPAFRERIRTAARRVILYKFAYIRDGGEEAIYPDIENLDRRLPDPEAEGFFFDQACRAATRLEGELPFDTGEGEGLVIAGPFGDLFSAASLYYPKSTAYRFPYQGIGASDTAGLKATIRGRAAIVCVANEEGRSLAEAAIAAGGRVAILSALNPAHALGIKGAAASVAVYGWSRETFEAGLAALKGLIPADGKLPFPGGEGR